MMESRRTSIPILHTRGTFYEVGYDVVSPILVWTEKKVIALFDWPKCHVLSSILPYISYIATLLRYLNFHWSRTLENIFE